MSMRDLMGKLARIDESMKSDAKKPTGPKFVGKWKGTDPASAAKDKLVGASESILKDLEKAITESPSRDIKEEYKRYTADWCQVCGQSPCNCTTVSEGVEEGYSFKGKFPFDVDHMPGAVIRNRDETTDIVKTKNKDRWDDEVDRINDEVFDDMADFRTNSEGETVTGNSAVWAKWDNATQTGWINRKGQQLKPWPVKEQGVAEDSDNRDDIVKECAHHARIWAQSENLRGMFTVDQYIFKKLGVQDQLSEGFNSKQEVINHFVKQGKTAAQGAAAWERGFRGDKKPATNMKDFKFKQPPTKSWQELDEYGGVGGYGAASQAPTGTSQAPDPAEQQKALDAAQIQKNTGQIASQLNQQGAAQPLNKVKFSDTMTKLDDQPNADLSAQELKQLEPMAVATSKALQNPQTAAQMKQLISKSDTVDKQKELKVHQAQQQAGTNLPAGQQPQQSTNTQQPPAGQTK